VQAATVVDGHLEWQQHPDPEPGAGEVLVDVRAAGVNNADLLQRAGLYPAPPGSPADVPGLELAGEVVACGPGATRFAEGDRVMAVVGGGGHAELAVVHERAALPVPPGMSWAQAGGFPEAYTTAHDALFSQCELGMGESVLVHAAAGGVGLAGVQLASAAGARVTASVRNPDLRDRVAELGDAVGGPAVTVVPDDDFEGRGPFDVVLELVGGPNLATDLRALAVGGRIVVIGVGAGAKAEVNLMALMSVRGRIHGSTLRARPLEDKALAARRVEREVLPLVAAGRLEVPVEATLPFDQPDAAYDRFGAGGKLGKLVLLRS
jgi:putative PIG3 family NAD(P)H quinone oxidoreductase